MAQAVTNLDAVARQGTFSSLSNPNFRTYFFGQLISMSGTWMQTVAQSYLVFSLTKSELWLGLVACAAGLPVLLISPYAGVFLERMPRRRLLLVTQIAQMVLALLLALLVFAGTVQTWQIFVFALLLGATNAFDAPARQAIVRDLVGLEHLASGIAVNSMIIHGARVIGPSFAGAILLTLGAAWCFLLNGISFLFVIVTLLVIAFPNAAQPKTGERPLQQFREGLRFARESREVRALLLLSTVGGLFTWSIIQALLSAFADRVLNAPEAGLAIITAANGVGALLAGLLLTSGIAAFGRGRYISLVAVGMSLFLFVFSRTTTIPAATLTLFAAGYCMVSYFVTINTTIQTVIPDEFRGRVLALYTLTLMGFTPFGSLLIGIIAEIIGTPNAIALFTLISGGLIGVVLARYPELRRLV